MSGSLSQRNVVLVVLDSARADLFAAHAPNFSKLSSQGIRFERAIAPAGWTLPSHASMFSGLAPSEHKMVALGTKGGVAADRKNAARLGARLAREGKLIAPFLSDGGIRTFSATSSPWLWKGLGLDFGFDDSDFFYFLGRHTARSPSRLPKRAAQVLGSVRSMRQYARWVRQRQDKGAARVLESIGGFVRRGGPFFAFTNLIETHEPHFPPAGVEHGLGRRELAALAANLILQPPLVRIQRFRAHNYGIVRLPRRLLKLWHQAYLAEIDYIDRWIARLMETLDEARVLDETTIIVTSDHGENLGEDGVIGHGLSAHEVAARVPLGMWGAGVTPEVVTEPVSLMSVPVTLRDLLLEESHDDSMLAAGGRGFAAFEVENPICVSRPPIGARRRPHGPGAAFYDGTSKLTVDPWTGDERLDGGRGSTGRQRDALQAWRDRVSATG